SASRYQLQRATCPAAARPASGNDPRAGLARRLVSTNLEHDLATLPAARDSLERRPGLRERKNRVDLRSKRTCVHERSQLQQLIVVGLDDEIDRARHLLCDR